MKKNIISALCISYLLSSFLHASSFSVCVPQRFLNEKASLVLYMLDNQGNSCIGTCPLNQESSSRKIFQRELCFTTSDQINSSSVVIDLTLSAPAASALDVVFRFELDDSMDIVRISVVKDMSLVVSEADDFDELSDLLDGVDVEALARSDSHQNNRSMFAQYKLYAELFALVQYGRAKRAIHDVSAWLSSSRSSK